MMNRGEFIEQNINLVYVVIREYYPMFISDEDIIQCGMLGLCKAADKWKKKGKNTSRLLAKLGGVALHWNSFLEAGMVPSSFRLSPGAFAPGRGKRRGGSAPVGPPLASVPFFVVSFSVVPLFPIRSHL